MNSIDESDYLTGFDRDYHDRQFRDPYQSTIMFGDWLVELGVLGGQGSRVCDLGCGKGASLYYFANRFAGSEFLGMDIDEALIREGQEWFSRNSVANCRLIVGDLHRAPLYLKQGEFDGIISLQTLSWLPGFEKAFDSFAALSPSWIALTSLFFDGPIEARTTISEMLDDDGDGATRQLYYNTYSLPAARSYLGKLGFRRFEFRKFEIPIDLPRTGEAKMQTYTERTADGRRLQISGPLLMNWYFVFAARTGPDC